MSEPSLEADCARCAALCCVAPAFDRSDDFGFDKPADTACPNLTAGHRCAIHDDLPGHGFRGCAQYDCLGAGQRVTQEIFAGRSWRDHPALAKDMFEAFRLMRRVHELLELLHTASRLTLTPAQTETHRRLTRALSPAEGWSQPSLAAFEHGTLPQQVQAFLISLRASVAPADSRPA